jgi:AcrR family transcriptional regulator
MSRRETNPPERLVGAAVDLFFERGYEKVTADRRGASGLRR